MIVTFEIFFRDLKLEAQNNLLEKFKTTERNENWDVVPLAALVREVEEPYL